ncbi:S8 family serine peptidase [Lysobacter sp. Root494]|uniref:S8 family peptidase n=1 Tax=Lysobacter sp. Root494 TaxID=1736549 RepID=UPI0007011AF3|nr:S8 family serine peptidase [Lysobacter sp. Root494]KQY54999.1 Subtilisin DY [Lysobacter sp. Root494]
MIKSALSVLAVACLLPAVAQAAPGSRTVGVNVLLNTDPSPSILAQLGAHGTVRDVLVEIDAVALRTTESELAAIRALPFVVAANPDAARNGSPVDTVAATSFANGISTWDQDAVDVTSRETAGRTVAQDGNGIYVAVLDTGLLDTWRQYFPQERIATQFAKAFNGGGGEQGNVSEPTNKWEHDQNSHGSHVTSTILGYSLGGVPINGTAPKATVIPVKVLNQNGSGWSSVVAAGIVYVADLKASGALGDAPVVINMSLGGSQLDAMEKAAIDYAIGEGVVIVASAGNEGEDGMGYPGAYAPVISVAATGWNNQWKPGGDGNPNNWWNADNVAEPTSAADFHIADFSSRELAGQDLDVAAPGSWVVGPYQTQSGKTSFFYLSGTSMASPHVAGIAALMLQKNPTLQQADVEDILETAALPMGAGCAMLSQPSGPAQQTCWGADATGSGIITAANALAATP